MDIKKELTQISSMLHIARGNCEVLLKDYALSGTQLDCVLDQTERAVLRLRLLAETVRTRPVESAHKPPAPEVADIVGTIEVNEFGWVHITLNTLLPNCKYKTPHWLQDTLAALLSGYPQNGRKLPRYERALLVIEEHCSIESRQVFLGCNDQMTAKYISDKCGMVTIRTTTSQIPMQPLFSPIYNTTKPYSQGRSNAQRPLMYPDELLRLDNAREIVLFRGQNPLMLYKIIPDELPAFRELRPMRAVEYTPEWRKQKIEQKEQVAKAPKAPPPESVSFTTQLCDQPSFFDDAPAKEETSAQASAPSTVSESVDDVAVRKFTYVSVKPTTLKDGPHMG